MTMQTSGAISLSQIQTEFGGTNPISLSEYYGADDGVPTSNAISFSDFYGTSSFVGGLMAETEGFPRSVSASGASGTRTSTTSVTLPAGTRSVFFAGATLDNGFETVSFQSVTVNGDACTKRASTSDTGEYTSNAVIYDLTFSSALTSSTTYDVVVTMNNSSSASGSASLWMFISEFAVTSVETRTGQEGGASTTMNLWDRGLVIGVGQSGSGGGSTTGAFDTYVDNPYPGLDGSWGSFSRGYGYFIPPLDTSATVGVSASTDYYAQAVAMASYRLS